MWLSIVAAYGEAHRHYHTLDHIAATVTAYDRVSSAFADPQQALLALFFHDFVYDPARSDNEARSADRLRDALPDVDTGRARRHILATKTHQASDDADTNVVVDIDMSILGASWPEYLRYARAVCREYLPVYGAQAYGAGRVAMFLTPTLERDHIFLTEPFAVLETQARRNLMAERDLWQAGQFEAIHANS